MFGIGFGEFVIIALVLIVAVGPDKLPALMKTVGRTLRQVKKTSEDLRRSTGIDELMRENLWEEPRPASPPRNLPASPPEGTRPVGGSPASEKTEEANAAQSEETGGASPSEPGSATKAPDSETAAKKATAPASAAARSEADPADAARKEGTH